MVKPRYVSLVVARFDGMLEVATYSGSNQVRLH